MSWQYHIVKQIEPEGGYTWSIHEVYYDDDAGIIGRTESPEEMFLWTEKNCPKKVRKDFRKLLERMLHAVDVGEIVDETK